MPQHHGWSLTGRLLTGWLASPAHQRQFDVMSGTLLLFAATLLALQTAGLP
jgi:threonine/homoserine/homoserine lactone efflux protein